MLTSVRLIVEMLLNNLKLLLIILVRLLGVVISIFRYKRKEYRFIWLH